MKPFKLIITLSFLVFACSDSKGNSEPWQLNFQDGSQFSSSQLKDQATILHFWASWCPYCKKVQPGIERIGNKNKTIRVLGVNFREDDGLDAQKILDQRGLTFKTLIKGESLAKQMKIRGTPTTVFFDRTGKEVFRTNTSDPNSKELEKGLQLILNN